MKLVFLESPYAGAVELNVRFARDCMLDCLARGESPFAGHLLYTQILDDNDKEQRLKGIVCAYQWMVKSDLVVVYIDNGISSGMKAGIERAKAIGKPIEYRKLQENEE